MVAMVSACTSTPPEEATGVAIAQVGVTGVLPPDATCTHIVATRLADFQVTELKGGLAGASFMVPTGETRVTATAYPSPCSAEPSQPPWLADAQVATFVAGPNTLTIHFHQNDAVTIDPVFDDNTVPQVTEAAARVRVSRNNEDAAGPNFSLDGWEVKRIGVPPLAPSEAVVFSMEGKGGLPYSPRGLAAMPDGTFVAQVAETDAPLRLFDGAGNFVESWAVVYPSGTRRPDSTDGLDPIDASHLVRTGFFNNGFDCDADGNCTQALIETLERFTAFDGSHQLRVTGQLKIPAPFAANFPVGVTALPGGRFAVSVLPDTGSALIVLASDGSLVAGPTAVPGDVEGLFVAADGRLGGIDYHGHVAMYDATTLAPRGETASYPLGIDLAIPNGLAWNPTTGSFLALSDTDRRVVSAPPGFATATNTGINLGGYFLVSGMDYRVDTNQVLIADRVPPIDSVSGKRVPAIDVYDLATAARVSRVTLQGLPLPLRTFTVAYVASRHQLVAHFRRPGSVPDATLDAVAFTSNLDGSPAGQFDLAPLGVRRITSVDYLALSDELLFGVVDQFGVSRYLVTSPSGTPRRSYRTDSVAGLGAVAQITSGPGAGELGFLINQPSLFVPVTLP